MSDRRTASADFGGWRQVRLRHVRIKLMADDSGLDADANRSEPKHSRAAPSSAGVPISLQIPFWREIRSRFHVSTTFTWQTCSPRLCGFAGTCSRLWSVSWLVSQWAARSCIFLHILMHKISGPATLTRGLRKKLTDAINCSNRTVYVTVNSKICWRCCCSWFIHPSESQNTCINESKAEIKEKKSSLSYLGLFFALDLQYVNYLLS